MKEQFWGWVQEMYPNNDKEWVYQKLEELVKTDVYGAPVTGMTCEINRDLAKVGAEDIENFKQEYYRECVGYVGEHDDHVEPLEQARKILGERISIGWDEVSTNELSDFPKPRTYRSASTKPNISNEPKPEADVLHQYKVGDLIHIKDNAQEICEGSYYRWNPYMRDSVGKIFAIKEIGSEEFESDYIKTGDGYYWPIDAIEPAEPFI